MTHEPANTTGKGSSDKDTAEEPVPYTVLSHRVIALWAVLIVAAGIGMAVWLLLAYGNDGDARVQLDAIRTAGTLVVGAGGAAALLLAARRQRTAEIALKQKDRDQADVARAHALQELVAAETRAHQERVALNTEHDAAQRRITELYIAAAAQLGSDKAPVRLAGLYALERLAQDNPAQRQTIVNVLCAYLRMPYTLPGDPPVNPSDPPVNPSDPPVNPSDPPVNPSDPPVNPSEQLLAVHRERVQEREVRLTAQRVLTAHLRPGDKATPADTFWANTDLDLTGAILIDLDLDRCHLRTAQFTRTHFAGHASFGTTEFAGDASFIEAEFAGDTATFSKAKFAGDTSFDKVKFAGTAWFAQAEFTGAAMLTEAEFAGAAWFIDATFASTATFSKAKFADATSFHFATFTGRTSFDNAELTDIAEFANVVFAWGVPPEVEQFWSPPEEEVRGQTVGPADPAPETG